MASLDMHKYTVQEAGNLGFGQAGAVTIDDTNTHYGRYVAIQGIADSVFNSLTEEGNYCNGVQFDTGTTEISVGDIIEGATSGAQAIIKEITVASGTWAGGNAAGYIIFEPFASDTDVLFNATEDIDIIDHNGNQLTDDAAHVVANGATDGATELSDETLKAGMVIYGNFTKVELASGVVRAYKG